MAPPQIRNVAKNAAKLGLSVLPVDPLTKKPDEEFGLWKQCQEIPLSDEEIDSVFHKGCALAIICGEVSGNLELLDFDIPRFWDAFEIECRAKGLGELLNTLIIQETPSGGRHIIYRCPDGIEHNSKLAWAPYDNPAEPKKKREIAIETRGEGGYFLTAPSRNYKLVQGSWSNVPSIGEQDRQALWDIATSLCECPREPFAPSTQQASQKTGRRPSDAFNANHTWAEILEPLGWRIAHRSSGGRQGWVRPGKAGSAIGATTGNIGSRQGDDLLYVHTTNADPLESDRSYSKFDVWVLFEHNGDFMAAVEAAKKMYPLPERPEKPDKPERQEREAQHEEEKEYRLTDIGLSERFVDTYSDSLRHVPEQDVWLECENDIWVAQPGGDGPAIRKAIELGRVIADELTEQANEIDPGDDKQLAKIAEALHKKATNMERTATISNMIKLAKPMSGMLASLDSLDADPWLIGTLDGVVDLRTLEVLPNGKEHLLTRRIPHHWTPEKHSDLFEDFVAQILCYKPDLVKLMKCWLGYCWLGHNLDQKFMIMYGDRGRNGKTTMFNVLGHVFGRDYSGTLDKRLLLETKNPANFALANIEGRRVAFASETHRHSRIDTEFIKEFSGGSEMTAERKGKQGYEFRPIAKLMFAVNRLPAAQFDNSLMDRMIAVPFEQSFYDKDDPNYREGDLPKDPQIENKLRDDTPGIIGFLAQCCLLYQQEGLPKAIDSQRLAADFEAENDYVTQWIADRCELGDYSTKTMVLFSSYKSFCAEMGIHVPGRSNEFSRQLATQEGITKVSPHNVSHMQGIRLREQSSADYYWSDK